MLEGHWVAPHHGIPADVCAVAVFVARSVPAHDADFRCLIRELGSPLLETTNGVVWRPKSEFRPVVDASFFVGAAIAEVVNGVPLRIFAFLPSRQSGLLLRPGDEVSHPATHYCLYPDCDACMDRDFRYHGEPVVDGYAPGGFDPYVEWTPGQDEDTDEDDFVT